MELIEQSYRVTLLYIFSSLKMTLVLLKNLVLSNTNTRQHTLHQHSLLLQG